MEWRPIKKEKSRENHSVMHRAMSNLSLILLLSELHVLIVCQVKILRVMKFYWIKNLHNYLLEIFLPILNDKVLNCFISSILQYVS